MSSALKIAMVGFGAIGRSLAALIQEQLPQVNLIGIAKRSAPSERDRASVHAATRFVDTPAQSAEAANGPVDVFEGTPREAALRFPQNANVAATVALAGIGFEETRVRLIADPQLHVNQHAVQADGTFGRFELTVRGNPQSAQPKTSVLAAFSLARYLTHRQSVLSFA